MHSSYYIIVLYFWGKLKAFSFKTSYSRHLPADDWVGREREMELEGPSVVTERVGSLWGVGRGDDSRKDRVGPKSE